MINEGMKKASKTNQIRNKWFTLNSLNNRIEEKIRIKTEIYERIYELERNYTNEDYLIQLDNEIQDLQNTYIMNAIRLSRLEDKLNNSTNNIYVGGFEIIKNLR